MVVCAAFENSDLGLGSGAHLVSGYWHSQRRMLAEGTPSTFKSVIAGWPDAEGLRLRFQACTGLLMIMPLFVTAGTFNPSAAQTQHLACLGLAQAAVSILVFLQGFTQALKPHALHR